MKAPVASWIGQGAGRPPRLAWSYATAAPLTALRWARETGEILAADERGTLYRLDRSGKLLGRAAGPGPVRSLGWSDTGGAGAALVGEDRVQRFDRQLGLSPPLELHEPALALAVEPHGHSLAVGLASGKTAIYTAEGALVRRYATLQPAALLEFLVSGPALVSVTEYGLLCGHSFTGESLWQQQLFGSAGDLAVSGDGQTILLAGFGNGVQRHDGSGVQLGSYQVGGTVHRVATGFVPTRIVAATQERTLHYLESGGEVIWDAAAPEPVARLACDPFGLSVLCGLERGQILRLDWDAE